MSAQKFNGTHWSRAKLTEDAKLVTHLGHGGSRCPGTPENFSTSTLTVIATTGIHVLNVVWCSCSHSIGKGADRFIQVLRNRWFPASTKTPKTAVTFECLSIFHLLTVQAKVTGSEFYQTLVYLTDNTGQDPPSVSSFLRILTNIIY